MLFVHSATAAMTGAGAGGRTYDEFVAHITALAESGDVAWTLNLALASAGVRKYTTTAAAFSGTMFGSPAAGRVAVSDGYSTVARLIQHALPNGDVSGATVGQKVYFEVERLNDNRFALTGKTINGFTSQPIGVNTAWSGPVRRILWWSGARAWWRDPFNDTAPQPYDWED